MRLALTLLALLAMTAQAQVAYGVRVQTDIPITDIETFVRSPGAYAATQDVLDVRAFGEVGRWGLEARYRTSAGGYVGGYYIASLSGLFGQYQETTVGIHVGYGAAGASVSLRGTILFYGGSP